MVRATSAKHRRGSVASSEARGMRPKLFRAELGTHSVRIRYKLGTNFWQTFKVWQTSNLSEAILVTELYQRLIFQEFWDRQAVDHNSPGHTQNFSHSASNIFIMFSKCMQRFAHVQQTSSKCSPSLLIASQTTNINTLCCHECFWISIFLEFTNCSY